jgi:hypothetical protein
MNKLIKMGMACNTNGEKRNTCRTLVGKQYGKRSLERPKSRWININKSINISKYINKISLLRTEDCCTYSKIKYIKMDLTERARENWVVCTG